MNRRSSRRRVRRSLCAVALAFALATLGPGGAARADQGAAVCVDRLVAGWLDAQRRVTVYLFEFSRRTADGGTVDYRYRAWTARPDGVRLVADRAWNEKGEPCAPAHGKEIRIAKPSGDRLEVGLQIEGTPLTQILVEPRRTNTTWATPLSGGQLRASSSAATVMVDGEPVRGVASWIEIAHDRSAGAAVPPAWTVAFEPTFDTWTVIAGLKGGGMAAFTEAGGTYSRGAKNTVHESATLVDPDTKVALPKTVTHSLPWAKARLEITYDATWSEPAGGKKKLLSAILCGDGHATGPGARDHSVTAVAWFLGPEPRAASSPPGGRKRKAK